MAWMISSNMSLVDSLFFFFLPIGFHLLSMIPLYHGIVNLSMGIWKIINKKSNILQDNPKWVVLFVCLKGGECNGNSDDGVLGDICGAYGTGGGIGCDRIYHGCFRIRGGPSGGLGC